MPKADSAWGSEKFKISFSKSANGASISSDKSLTAIAVKEDIHIYETATFTKVIALKGHVSGIEGFDFHPKDPNLLVSSVSAPRDSPGGGSTILFWDLDEERKNPMLDENTISKIASEAAETVFESLRKADPGLHLSPEDEKNHSTSIEPAITKIVKTRGTTKRRSLKGRLRDGFQSHIFSPSGEYLIYMPGDLPRSNDTDTWDIKTYSMSTHQDLYTLSWHTDAIMWTGFSPDEKFIGTVSWN